jgi:class 3 adenylate cyclase/tetratricopeptide (TPR) repeat protein
MRCSKCGSDNRQGRKFCTACGTPLVASCPKCGVPIQPDERFCGECGVALGDVPTPAAQEARHIPVLAIGERRHLTVLFCDLVGSSEIAAKLDPEEWREMVAAYHRAAGEVITRYGGHVAKYLGDGVMAFFGYPEAHDNDAERAVRAGLAILDAIAKLNDQTQLSLPSPGHSPLIATQGMSSGNGGEKTTPAKLAARVGIDSGAVVVGTGAGKDTDVFGEAPNMAARVQMVAIPGTVLITADTHRLVSGLFVVEEREAQEVKGVSKPIVLYRVIRPTGVRGRLGAARGLTPFVGRDEELRILLSRWERAREGDGQVALIVGEAGIGKSRLVAEFRDRIRETPHVWMESAGQQFFESTPFYAITEMLAQWLELQGGVNAAEKLQRAERALTSAGLKVAEAAPVLANVLQLPVEGYPALNLAPDEQRRRLLATLTKWAFGAAFVQPLVMVVEDLHWLDPSTLELQQLLAEQGATVPLMLLYTARPEFHAPWPMRSHHTQITLSRLSARNAREMVALIAARTALASESVDAVIERTGGVPLFVEELTRAVLEGGPSKLTQSEIPVTLHDSLMARLDRLGSAKEVIQVGAVIGSEFSYELLRAIYPMAEEDLKRALRSLTHCELLYERGIPPDATYLFKHALLRDAAYDALLKSRRKQLHRRIAESIVERFEELAEIHPEILARHLTEAGETEAALAQWVRAGKAAEARSAFKEALDIYEQSLRVVSLLTPSPERDSRELTLRQSVVALLNVTKGYAAPETIAAVENTVALAEKTGNTAEVVNLLMSRGSALLVAGDLAGASAIADQALNLAVREANHGSIAYGHALQTALRYCLGDLKSAEEHFSAWSALFTVSGRMQSGLGSPLNLAVNTLAFGGFNAWLQGRADVARERERQMIALAKTGGPFEASNSKYCAALLEIYLRNYEEAETLAADALDLAEKHQLPNSAARSRCQLGLARAFLGHATEGMAILQEGISSLRKIGTHMILSAAILGLAEAQKLAGAATDALDTIEEALQVLPDELSHRPEALRLRGELRFKQGTADSAENDFRESIQLAQTMGAKAWELRTALSLARLLASQGRLKDARAMLAEVYSRFTEGFDTADLKDAKALLDELNE